MNITRLSKEINFTRYFIQFHKWIGFGINTELVTGPTAILGCITLGIVRPLNNESLSELKAAVEACRAHDPKGPPCS